MKIIIKSIPFLFVFTLIGCSSARISPEQMDTVTDSALYGGPPDTLGGSATTSVGNSLPYSLTGGGGL